MYELSLSESYCPAPDGKPLIKETIGETLCLAAQDSPEKIALMELCDSGQIGRQWTYSELYKESLDLAYRLSAKYEKGTRIAICANNIPEWVILEYAAALSGMVVVTVNPSFQASEMNFIIEQSGAVAMYFVQSVRGNPVGDIASQVMAGQPKLECIIDMHDEEAFYAKSSPKADSLPELSSQDTVQIQYTSGTTGFPKGAILHHCGILNNASLVGDRLGMSSSDTYINMMPMFHTGGCGVGTLATLVVRARNILAARFDPGVINKIIERECVSHFLAVPTMLVGILENLAEHPRKHESVKGIVSGGAMVAPTLLRKARQQWACQVQVIYGQTEASPIVTQAWQGDSLEDLTETAGQPLPHTDISIRHLENNTVMPLGEVGEICARGYSVMHGYNDNPEATAETIDAEGWLHTGDLGRMDGRGYIKITGRVKEMIIRGGENLFPVEIENGLLTHPLIAEVSVVGIPDEKWGELVACFVRMKEGAAKLSVNELIEYSREVLSPQKTPSFWVYVDELPLTASGKVQKFKLKEDFETGLYEPLLQ